MSTAHQFVASILKASIAACGIASAAQATEHVISHPGVDAQATHHTGAAKAHIFKRRAPLDLRIPDLNHVMAHGVLLRDISSGSDEDAQPVEIAAAPDLMPMISEQQAPLGLIAAFAWSGDHSTQAWRILLPLSQDSIS